MFGYRIMPAKIIFMLSILDCRVLLPAWVSEEALANDMRERLLDGRCGVAFLMRSFEIVTDLSFLS